jgi:beta-galactosidase
LPAWLFADSGIVLRSTDPKYTTPAARWLDRLGRELRPLLSSNGGPIIAVQVENEYGSFDRDTAYMAWERDALKHAGFGSVLMYTADGDVQLPRGSLPDLPAVVNFGPGEADSAFARLIRFRPDGPRMSGEYWAGWFDQWGGRHHTTNDQQQTSELSWMLERGYSVNLYMFHGGTTPGFMNGANIDNGHYHPQTSSYDYDAALDESGRPTAKYFMFRDAIAKATHQAPAPLVSVDSTISIPTFTLDAAAPLWYGFDDAVHRRVVSSMESFGQAYGYILYSTVMDNHVSGNLAIKDVRDYAQVFVDRQLVGTLDRRNNQDSLPIDVPAGTRLNILVENSGRVNFNKALRDEQKGITKGVWLNGTPVLNWDILNLPMDSMPAPSWQTMTPTGPAYYKGSFRLRKTGDTFLDMRGWGKGTVWVNGHQLGRFWGIGPQRTLYVPAPWLKVGANDVVVFDLEVPGARTMMGVNRPIL